MQKQIKVLNNEVQAGDIFVVERRNKQQTAYIIVYTKDRTELMLVNLDSGQSNYRGHTIKDLVIDCLKNQKNLDIDKINPMIAYYFVKNYEASFHTNVTFGYTKLY